MKTRDTLSLLSSDREAVCPVARIGSRNPSRWLGQFPEIGINESVCVTGHVQFSNDRLSGQAGYAKVREILIRDQSKQGQGTG
jgi:hypothetical protein